jgi:hypothetical protein
MKNVEELVLALEYPPLMPLAPPCKQPDFLSGKM